VFFCDKTIRYSAVTRQYAVCCIFCRYISRATIARCELLKLVFYEDLSRLGYNAMSASNLINMPER
jgi:hypothetical protein